MHWNGAQSLWPDQLILLCWGNAWCTGMGRNVCDLINSFSYVEVMLDALEWGAKFVTWSTHSLKLTNWWLSCTLKHFYFYRLKPSEFSISHLLSAKLTPIVSFECVTSLHPLSTWPHCILWMCDLISSFERVTPLCPLVCLLFSLWTYITLGRMFVICWSLLRFFFLFFFHKVVEELQKCSRNFRVLALSATPGENVQVCWSEILHPLPVLWSLRKFLKCFSKYQTCFFFCLCWFFVWW